MTPKLSICIPTYNRAKFLKEALETIIPQADPEKVEIVISDNASEDNTQEIVEGFQKKHPNITYWKAPENRGADRNYLKIVELAKGDFCWLFGSDDIFEKGAVDKVLEIIEKHPDLSGISVNRWDYDFNLTKHIGKGWHQTESMHYDKWEEILDDLYLYWGYLSGQIINRKIWNEVISGSDEYKGFYNAYVQVFIKCRMVQKNPKWYYEASRQVGWRSDNDSFLSHGFFNRYRIDAIGYPEIIAAIAGKNSPLYHSTVNKLMRDHVTAHLKVIRMFAREKGASKQALGLSYKQFKDYPYFWGRLLPWFLIPSPALRTLRWGYQQTLKKWTK